MEGRPQLNQRLSKVLGSPFANGNVIFHEDKVLSPVGNRLTIYDLKEQSVSTLPIETRKNIRRCCMSHNGKFAVLADVDGHSIIVSLVSKSILQRFNFRRKIYDIKFSPDDRSFAVTHGHGVQLWRTPNVRKEFQGLILLRKIAGHYDDTTCLDWSKDSNMIVMGSKDLTARVYYRVHSRNMSKTTLTGHRDIIVGSYFSEDNDMVFTIAQDGAVFTWQFAPGERRVVGAKKRRHDEGDVEMNGTKGDNGSDSDSSDGSSSGNDSDDNDKEEEDDEEEEEDDEDDNNETPSGYTEQVFLEDEYKKEGVKTVRGGSWLLTSREFLWDPHTRVSCTSFNRSKGLLVIGFDNGVFGLYEMPGVVNLQRISANRNTISSVSINYTGEWIALGSSRLGQLMVWEWQSESYVLKQQGHIYGLNSMDYSDDGMYIATGAEDSKVKLWNVFSGFCFMTFDSHKAPVTCVRFVGKGSGKAVLSASLDGTIRAHELLRYKNFRTLQGPPGTPLQFTCLSADKSGEVVCAGSMDPFLIHIWSLQTGKLLDVLSGHEGPIAALDMHRNMLASTSWDGTIKLWDVYKNECMETVEHGCDVLAVAFRPDGLHVATATINGNINVWEVETGDSIACLEGRDDLKGGIKEDTLQSGKSQNQQKCFTTLCYSADGSLILAAGRGIYACVYSVKAKTLVHKFQLTSNRSLDGTLDRISSLAYEDGVNLASLRTDQGSDDEQYAVSVLPGAGKGSGTRDGTRNTRPELVCTSIKYSPTGRDWSVATTQGLQMFTLDFEGLFVPMDLDIMVTPQAVAQALEEGNYAVALNFSLQLADIPLLRKAIMSIEISEVPLQCRTIDKRLLQDFLKFIADEISNSVYTEVYLTWSHNTLTYFGPFIQSDPVPYQAPIRALKRAMALLNKEVLVVSDANEHKLALMMSQMRFAQEKEEEAEEAAKAQKTSISIKKQTHGNKSAKKGKNGFKQGSDGDDLNDNGASNNNDNGEAAIVSHKDFPSLSHNAFNSSDKNRRSFGKAETATSSPDNMYAPILKESKARSSKGNDGGSEVITEAILEEMGRTMKSSGWSDDDEEEGEWEDEEDFGATSEHSQPTKEEGKEKKNEKIGKKKKERTS